MISLEGPTNKSHRDSTHNFHILLLMIGYQPNGESFGYGVSFFFAPIVSLTSFPIRSLFWNRSSGICSTNGCGMLVIKSDYCASNS